MSDISIGRVEPAAPAITALLDELNEALAGPYSQEQRHALSVDQLFQPNIRFFVVRLNGEAGACGSVGS